MITNKIIKELKVINDVLEEEIKSAHIGMRNNTASKCQKARTKIQEAITELLESS